MNEATFTVKWLRDDGMFDLWPALAVTFCPSRPSAAVGGETTGDCVQFFMPDGDVRSINYGTVFVMNASGKTIQVVHLDHDYSVIGRPVKNMA